MKKKENRDIWEIAEDIVSGVKEPVNDPKKIFDPLIGKYLFYDEVRNEWKNINGYTWTYQPTTISSTYYPTYPTWTTSTRLYSTTSGTVGTPYRWT